MMMNKIILLSFVFIILISLACDDTEGKGGGGLQPGSSDPLIIEGFICAGVDDSKPLAIDNDFFPDDEVYIWLSWEQVSGEHQVKIIWVNPDNDVVTETNSTFNSKNGKWITFYYIDTVNSAPSGKWLAEVYMDGKFVRSYAFWLLEG
jgi:hypothetical protein